MSLDLSGVEIKPAEGMVALKFVDEDDDQDDAMPSAEPVEYEGCLAIVVGVGPKVTGVKKGDTVITRPYARDGLLIGDGIRICDSYCVAGTIK